MSTIAPIIGTVLIVGITLGVVLPVVITQGDALPSSDTMLSAQGDPWGGNTRARNARAPADQILFPLHNENQTTFVARHRCPGICSTDFSTLGTNERELSNSIFAQASTIPDARGLNSLVPFWGQFALAHDMVLTHPNATGQVFSINMSDLGAEVQPMELRRLEVEIDDDGCRNPKLFVTPYLDGTPVYSDYLDPARAALLREGEGGRLLLTEDSMLPRHPNSTNEFLAGDIRSTETGALASLHTVFARQHNRLAGMYREMNVMLDDNQLFWKARRALVAQMQRITYEEWLPALLGPIQYALYFGANLTETCAYNSTALPATESLLKTEVAVATFRLHTLVPNAIGPVNLTDIFFNATKVEEIGLDALLTYAAGQPAERFDAKVVDALRNMLFGTLGMDLVAINIARGRDVGLASYDDLDACYDLPTFSSQEFYIQTQLDSLAAGSSVSEVAAKVISLQLLDLCQRDPFFYTNAQTRFDVGTTVYDGEVTGATLRQVILNNTGTDPADLNEVSAFYRVGPWPVLMVV